MVQVWSCIGKLYINDVISPTYNLMYFGDIATKLPAINDTNSSKLLWDTHLLT